MLVKIRDLVVVSLNNYNKKDKWTVFNYLDTSNLTENVINQITVYNDLEELPGRAKQKIEIGDILYSSVRPNQRHFGFISKKMDRVLVSTGFIVLKAKKEYVDGKYLYYFLTQNKIISQLQTRAESSKSSYPSITSEDILEIQIDLPPLTEQNRISNILNRIECQILLNMQMINKLQVLGKSIFSRYFYDLSETTSLLNFEYITLIKPGIKRFDGVKNYVATAEVNGDFLNYNAPLITYDRKESRANMQPVFNSVWFAKMKNSIKHIYLSSASDLIVNNHIFSTGFCGIKCDFVSYEYLVNYFNMPFFEEMKDKLAHGATQEAVNNDDLRFIKILIPKAERLKDFHKKTKSIYENISRIEESAYRLTRLKNQLLELLVNGQLA